MFWRIDTTHWWLHRCAVVASAKSPKHSLFTLNGSHITIWTSTCGFGTRRGSGEHVQMCRLARAFATSTWDFDTYRTVQWLCLCKIADSPESTLLEWIAQHRHMSQPWGFSTVMRLRRACVNVQTRQSLRCQRIWSWYLSHCPVTIPSQFCWLTIVFAAGLNRTQIAILGSTWDFDTVTKAKVSLCKCEDSPEPSQVAQKAFIRHFSQHEIIEPWQRLRLGQANV